MIEHNLDVVKTADWVIDLGPDGGVKGGDIVAVGTPEAIAAEKASATGFYLKPLLEKSAGRTEPVAVPLASRRKKREPAAT